MGTEQNAPGRVLVISLLGKGAGDLCTHVVVAGVGQIPLHKGAICVFLRDGVNVGALAVVVGQCLSECPAASTGRAMLCWWVCGQFGKGVGCTRPPSSPVAVSTRVTGLLE
jgi:hypothetical protein